MRVHRKHRRYDDGFRRDAIALLERTDRAISKVAEDLGMPAGTLEGWYSKEMAKKGKKQQPRGSATDAEESVEERVTRLEKENASLRKENEDLKQDRAILKKAAAFFAKESE